MLALLGSLLLLVAPAGAQQARCLAGARAAAAIFGVANLEQPSSIPAVPPEVDALPAAAPGTQFSAQSTPPTADDKTAAWLASRIPGLDAKSVLVSSFESADGVVGRVADAKGDYLDLLSDPLLSSSQGSLYYLSQDVLARLDQKYEAGTLPVSGTTTDGRPFRMQGVVVGKGWVHYLYDQTKEFRFKGGDFEFKVGDGGHVVTQTVAPADVTVAGIQGCGCVLFFCGCADIQRITKVSPGKLKIQTTRGPRDSSILPITRK